jgi:type IV pilus assembly protein PilA
LLLIVFPERSTLVNCPYCAEIIPDDVQFCPKCGTQMGTPLPTPGSPLRGQPLPPGFEPATSGKAIGSLFSGLFFFFLPASIAAVILGHLSLAEIRKSAGGLKGQGIATAGLVLGYLGIAAIPFLLIIAAIAIPNLLRARMAANESSAVGTLRTYNSAIVSYAMQCSQQGFPATLKQLGPGSGDCNGANLLEQTLSSSQAIKNGYVFAYHPGPADHQGHVTSYVISADPVNAGTTGVRHFYVDETGIIRSEPSGPAGPDSQPIR